MQNSEKLLKGQEVTVAGGSESQEITKSSLSGLLFLFNCLHEEADTCIVLHAVDAANHGVKCVIVNSRDTDALVLLTYHQTANEVWMGAGTKTNLNI